MTGGNLPLKILRMRAPWEGGGERNGGQAGVSGRWGEGMGCPGLALVAKLPYGVSTPCESPGYRMSSMGPRHRMGPSLRTPCRWMDGWMDGCTPGCPHQTGAAVYSTRTAPRLAPKRHSSRCTACPHTAQVTDSTASPQSSWQSLCLCSGSAGDQCMVTSGALMHASNAWSRQDT